MKGDFNLDLLHYETHSQSIEFLDKNVSASLFLHITIPTRVTPCSKTLIDNIFINDLGEIFICGNLTYSISDHLAQFLIYTSNLMVNNFHQKKVLHRRNSKPWIKRNSRKLSQALTGMKY